MSSRIGFAVLAACLAAVGGTLAAWEGGTALAVHGLGVGLLIIPGLAVLAAGVGRAEMSWGTRLACAPGVTIAGCVVVFTWARVLDVGLGTWTPWMLLAGAAAFLWWRRAATWSDWRVKFGRLTMEQWFAGAALFLLLGGHLLVRLRVTHGWVVPPGIDSAHHTMIVQLLLEHSGLFDSWEPFDEATSFSYHFGFHAITALLAWLTGIEAHEAVRVMARLVELGVLGGVIALLRIWTRQPWAGVMAVLMLLLFSRHFHWFEVPGRWTLITGLTILPAAVVLVVTLAGHRRFGQVGLFTAVMAAGLGLSHYKAAITFCCMVAAFVIHHTLMHWCRRPACGLAEVRRFPAHLVFVALLAAGLGAPRLSSLAESRTSGVIQRAVQPSARPAGESPSATRSRPLELVRGGFETPGKAAASVLALLGAALVLARRGDALWFAGGWGLAALVMNPRLAGIPYSLNVLDEMNFGYSVQTGIGVFAGLAAGRVLEKWPPDRVVPQAGLLSLVLAIFAWNAAAVPPLPAETRFALAEDVRLWRWMRRELPAGSKIAGRVKTRVGVPTGLDSVLWVPYFTRHRTNFTNLAASLEQAPEEARRRMGEVTAGIYERDMSRPESAAWLRASGYRYFYLGADEAQVGPAGKNEGRDSELGRELERNPSVRLVREEGRARLFEIGR